MCTKFVLVSNIEKIESRFQVRLNQHTLQIPESYAVGGGARNHYEKLLQLY